MSAPKFVALRDSDEGDCPDAEAVIEASIELCNMAKNFILEEAVKRVGPGVRAGMTVMLTSMILKEGCGKIAQLKPQTKEAWQVLSKMVDSGIFDIEATK